jgi:hypothetical protein
MPTVRTDTWRVDGVTFVEVCVTAAAAHRIRLESRLEGVVWPPRSGGSVAAGWDEQGLTRVVPAGTTGFGFATPAPPAEPAVEVVAAEPVDGSDSTSDSELPEGIGAWLERVETRVATAEALAEAEDLHAAAEAVESAGGLAAVEGLVAELATDRRVLPRLSFVPAELCRRTEAVDVPMATLARIADVTSR